LTALTWQLRQLLPSQFGLSFTDADMVANRSLNEYEESLFLNPRANELVPMAELIRKTELQGDLYDTVMYGNQPVSYPRPFMFLVQLQDHHPASANGKKLGRVLCLYDNAGEHFQPGQDTTSSPTTRHMAEARLLLFLFDPTQDQRFQKLCGHGNMDVQLSHPVRSTRQELVLQEAAARVRRSLSLPQNAKHNRPLLVVLTKSDKWSRLLDRSDTSEPWLAKGKLAGVDVERIEMLSADLRRLMLKACPELVAAAESFSSRVIYLAISALGSSGLPTVNGPGFSIRPKDIRPSWVTVPLLYGMCRWLPGLVPSLKREPGNAAARPSPAAQSGRRSEPSGLTR
jgi:hypothetical protein